MATVWHEVRLHPGRFVAVLAAVLISVAFMAATQVFATTEASAVAKRRVLYASQADVVVDSHVWRSSMGTLQRDQGLSAAERSLRSNPDVAHVERFSQAYTQLTHGADYAGVMLTSPVTDPLRWYQPSVGRAPTGPKEVMLTQETAASLHVGLGDTVRLPLGVPALLTVVGLTDERGYDDPPAYVVYDLMKEVDLALPPPDLRVLVAPETAERATPGSSGNGLGIRLLVATQSPEQAEAVVAETQRYLTDEGFLKITVQPKTAAQVRAQSVRELADGTEWMALLVLGCAVISVVVGMLITANTYAIIMAQRRRQVGLLRAVGADRSQIMKRFLTEALLIALAGSLLGMLLGVAAAALVSGLMTHSLRFGFELPWFRLLPILLLGQAATVVPAWMPIHRATRVTPVEALQVTPGHDEHANASHERAQVCGALDFLGASALVLAMNEMVPYPVLVAAAGALVLSIGVLGSASLFVPTLVRAIGTLVDRVHPVIRLATLNTRRNPRRVGATATALMLAVGLIVTVQVATRQAEASALQRLDARYPVDLGLQAAVQEAELADPNGSGPASQRDETPLLVGFVDQALDLVRTTPGVADAELLPTTEPLFVTSQTGSYQMLPFTALTPAANALLSHPVDLDEGTIGLSTETMSRLGLTAGRSVTLFSHGPLTGRFLRAVECSVGRAVAVVHPMVLKELETPTKPGLIVARLSGASDSATIISQVKNRLLEFHPGLDVSGGAELKASLRVLLDGVTLLITALLGIATLVAIVGMGNTLALSALERTRESGLLRALGLQRRGLAMTLLVEAVLVSLIAAAVGVLFGVLFGWAGAGVVLRSLDMSVPALQIDWVRTLLTGAVVLVAGALASVLPGRRAARVTPIEGLADIG